MTRLVIVESPAKAKKIGQFLGDGYVVEASVGHIRDLPQRAADIPAAYKGIAWAKEGVNVDNGFEPLYVVDGDKKKKVSELKALLKDATELLLATDEDREGEAIAWHLLEVLQPKVPVRRMVFHEITKEAILEAAANTRELDQRLVDAQETRRILDRLYGYRLSPVLWKKVMPRLSAGRVQSVATRLVVERERERIKFVASGWWDINAQCAGGFTARMLSVDGKRLTGGKDFGDDGKLSAKAASETLLLDEQSAATLVQVLEGSSLKVRSVEESARVERPKAPFTTSTLQQDAGRRLGWGAQITMRVAQRLYENGYITYMRTDSPTLSTTAINAARASAAALYGADHVAEGPRQYTGKAKNAQEAHEAVRPAGDAFRTPGEVANELSRDELSLYDLIWKRTVASQMADARKLQVRVDMDADASDGRKVDFRATGTVVTFPGFLAAYEEAKDDSDDDDARRLPPLSQGDTVAVEKFGAEGHTTQPPSRYTEPTLVARMEELGIGRPSTFATILQTIQDRGYVSKRGRSLVPTFLAFAVVGLLEQHFAKLVDYDFTASMEEDLDRIAEGTEDRVRWLTGFYFGLDGVPGLDALTADLGAIDAREVNTFEVGEGISLRVGRFGNYLEIGEGETRRTTNIPLDMAPDELTLAMAQELFNRPSGERILGNDPTTGRVILAKDGRYGPYVTEVLPDDVPTKGAKAVKAKTASLFKDMSLDTISIDDALKLFTLPRVVGIDPTTQVEITAQNGPFGPYLRRGTDSRTIDSEALLFTLTLDEAVAIYALPKFRGRGVAKPPLKELGQDPASTRAVVVKDGRFGAYVTDGETNATLRRNDPIETLTLDRALELLAEKRAKELEEGPRVKKRSPQRGASKAPKKAAAKKAATKKAPGKTAAKKAVAKKAPSKKPVAV
ncbi:MAG: type I DNA topoisomerase [Actinobacteria bacterium]|uniref:DNA topoisomerase n=1 Tax=freshwater metagenome TaxID=449393 RepID=A0A6J7FEG7_9ZZZZ|nr:type I DNA topoisomerase [Actinomycetota bacterium]MSY26477.1 type I DNA topoisomerase [Actinomycetota bacterium]MSZ86397.1 type I DNA topoisomerase [Actinomycetota bacterium]MTB14272.1 type I DNA topoisomerase [Actinomycetota bacterium]MTB24560.1 type I DNA topoisomerase [Actinomycetota bacterium]